VSLITTTQCDKRDDSVTQVELVGGNDKSANNIDASVDGSNTAMPTEDEGGLLHAKLLQKKFNWAATSQRWDKSAQDAIL
jgi:hypothetical protein